MFPPLRFTIAATIVTLIVITVASVPFVSFRLTHHSLPYVSHTDVPQSLVEAGIENFGARIAPASMSLPREPVVIAPAAPRTALDTAADLETTGTVVPTEIAVPDANAPVANSAAPIATPPVATKDVAKRLIETAPATQLEPSRETSIEKPSEAPRESPDKTAASTPVAAPAKVTPETSVPVAAATPAAANPAPSAAETTSSTPPIPAAEATAKTEVKKRVRKRRIGKRRARNQRARVRRQTSRDSARGPLSLLFGLGR